MFITRQQNATTTKSKNKAGMTTEMPPIVIAKNKIKPAQSFNIYMQHPSIVQSGPKNPKASNLNAYIKDS